MSRRLPPAVRAWSRVLHRDVGYFVTALVIAYALSGLALNHQDEWNPDFAVERREIAIERGYQVVEVGAALAGAFSARVGEGRPRLVDSPAEGQVKIYYDNAFLHLYLDERRGVYERLVRRPIFWDVNVLHRNSLKAWRWFADGFSVLLIFVNLTGLLVLRGRHGLSARGKWLIAAGLLPPIAALAVVRLG